MVCCELSSVICTKLQSSLKTCRFWCLQKSHRIVTRINAHGSCLSCMFLYSKVSITRCKANELVKSNALQPSTYPCLVQSLWVGGMSRTTAGQTKRWEALHGLCRRSWLGIGLHHLQQLENAMLDDWISVCHPHRKADQGWTHYACKLDSRKYLQLSSPHFSGVVEWHVSCNVRFSTFVCAHTICWIPHHCKNDNSHPVKNTLLQHWATNNITILE